MFRTLLFPIGLLLSPPHCPKPNHRSPVLPSQSKWYCPSINKIWKNSGKVGRKTNSEHKNLRHHDTFGPTSGSRGVDKHAWLVCRLYKTSCTLVVPISSWFFFMFADSIMNIMRITHIVQVMNIMLIKRSTLYNWFHPLLRNLIVSYFAYVSNQMLHQNIDYQMNYENKTPSALFLETSILLPELIIFPQECHRPSS